MVQRASSTWALVWCVYLILALGTRAVVAAEPPVGDLSAVLRPILAAHGPVPALFGAIVDHGRMTDLGVAGVRQAGSPAAVTADDPVHLGSDTKAMTAVLVARLVADGRVKWTDTVGSLFPDRRRDMDAAAAAVTVADLVRHTAGLPHDLPWSSFDATLPIREQRREAVRRALAVPPLTPPGRTFAYSNVGYVILGAIIEFKAGRSWEDEAADRLFRPLEMTTAGFGPPGTTGEVDAPWGHHLQDGRAVPTQLDNPPVMGPAGRVHCTMADWARFVGQFCGPTAPLLPASALAELTTPAVGQTYAGGWEVTRRPWAGGRVLTHAGSNKAWFCVAWVAPDRGFAVLAAANAGGDEAAKACDDVAAALIGRHAAARRPR